MSLREWLIIAGAVIIAGLLVDSVRRMYRARKDSIEISRDMGAHDLDASPIDDDYNPELPNGGARTVNRDGSAATTERRRPLSSGQPVKPTRRIIDRFTANTEADPAQDSGIAEPETLEPNQATYESFSATDETSVPELTEALETHHDSEPEEPIPELHERAPDPRKERRERRKAAKAERKRAAEEEAAQADEVSVVEAPETQQAERPLAGANRPAAQEVVVVNVHCRGEDGFPGRDLRKLFESCGMEHGDMAIYHRHEQPDTTSPVQFSVASAVKPGTFDPESMATEHYTGISFFMSLPGPSDPLTAFEYMLETAQCVVHNLGGELKDERQSVMTAQTTEHCRQRIREFERKRRSVRA